MRWWHRALAMFFIGMFLLGYLSVGVRSGIEFWRWMREDPSAYDYWNCIASALPSANGTLVLKPESFREADARCAAFRPSALTRLEAKAEWSTRFPDRTSTP